MVTHLLISIQPQSELNTLQWNLTILTYSCHFYRSCLQYYKKK